MYSYFSLKISMGWRLKFTPAVRKAVINASAYPYLKYCASPLPPSLCHVCCLHNCRLHDHYHSTYVHCRSCLCIRCLGTVWSCHHSILPSPKHLRALMPACKYASTQMTQSNNKSRLSQLEKIRMCNVLKRLHAIHEDASLTLLTFFLLNLQQFF